VTRARPAQAASPGRPAEAADLTVAARARSLPPMLRRMAAFVVLTTILWLPTVTPPPVAQAATCTGWTSTRVPPPTIRVLRTSTGRVQTIDFKTYVQRVLDVEWPSNWPTSAIETGAVAVKQYGWYYTMHYRGGKATGGCYDVVDNTNDQIYRDITPEAVFVAAVDATWDTTITRNGSFVLTGYRSGSTAASLGCGDDADGYHLFQHTSYHCGLDGKTAEEILAIYYGPNVEIWKPAPAPAALFLSPPPQGQASVGTSATIVWTEELASGTTITDRQLMLQMAAPRNGSCLVDRWLPALPAWQSTDPSPQTVSGLLPGYCYRAILTLTDSAASTTMTLSGSMLVDPDAPHGEFANPPTGVVTPLAGSTATITWTETAAPGATIVSRRLTTEMTSQPAGGTCTGALWASVSTSTAGSPLPAGGFTSLNCYRFRLDLTDSAGRTGTSYSGVFITPSA